MPPPIFNSTFRLPPLDTQSWPSPMLETLCPGDRPLALFPVRLETRFFTLPDGRRELRIRVYPDKVHLNSHEPDLTSTEHEWGRHFWDQDWRAGDNDEARASAWRQLAERFGDARAGWIARRLRPLNSQNRPAAAVPANAALAVAPQFPTIPVATADEDTAWRQAPVAQLMPDRWIAVIQSEGRPVIAAAGAPIVRPLQVGPDPRAPAPASVPPTDVAIPKGMKWMIDFDAAEAAGMALRVVVPPPVLSAGIDSLVVLGAASAASPAETQKQLQHLIDGHHYTDGFEFLPQGTPTNNTSDERTMYRADGGHQRSLVAEVLRDTTALSDVSNARRLGAALGIDAADVAEVLGRFPGADASHDADAGAMNTALWQVGWGYYLTNMIGAQGTGLTYDDVAWAREHFVRYVRAAGPFPAIRCGRQPYGILPVTSLDLWKPTGSESAAGARDLWLRDFLVTLRDHVWRAHLADAPRVGRRQDPPDADADLADVMRVDALSNGFKARAVIGRHYLQHLRAFVGEDLQSTGFLAAQEARAREVIERLPLGGRARLANGTYADMAWRVSAPLVQPGEVSRTRALNPNYIAALLGESTIAGIANAALEEATSLLQALLRHALLREYAQAAALIVGTTSGTDPLALLRDAELIDLSPDAPAIPTWAAQLDRVAAPVTGTRTVRQFLESSTTFADPQVAAIGEWRSSAKHLQQIDSEMLQILLQGTLDLTGQRLDAWITSLATKRLMLLRGTAADGIRAGAYGWVENLQPSGLEVVPVSPPAGEPGPIAAFADDSGFIHAPSFTHASTAALLRNAHLGSGTAGQADQPFAIDLSSRRAREAATLLDAMRQGQPLGAVLGYRIERRLHDLGLHTFVQVLRERAPLSARRLEASDQPLEVIAANNVVDGAALFEQWRQSPASLKDALQQAGASAADADTIGRQIGEVGDLIDAVSDALTAEAAYQVVRGNTSRTASTLKAIAAGDAPPPELEVVRTPRTGTALTHRVVVLFSGAAAAAPGWAAANTSPRAAADPVLNEWAAKLLGDPTKVRCSVERLGDTDDTVLETRVFPLSELGATPLDVVFAADLPASDLAGTSRSALEERVLYHARRGGGGFGDGVRVQVSMLRPADLPAGVVSLVDVVEHASAIRALLANTRGVDPDDLQPPERASGGTIDLLELEGRVEHAERALVQAHTVLNDLLKGGQPPDAGELQSVLLRLHVLGFNGAIPAAAGEGGAARAVLLQQGLVLLKDVERRLEKLQALQAVTADPDPRRRRDQLFARMRAVFGSGAAVTARFRPAPEAALELSQALAASINAQAGDPLAVYTWFVRSERVRDGLARLSAPLRGAEILGRGERLSLQVAQLPFTSGDRWVGLPPAANTSIAAGKLSLVVQSATSIETTQPMSGLWIDEWIDVVPNGTETTAVTFQYNAPDACAPQNVLLAVSPDATQQWTVATLYRVLVETLDLAKLRAVPLDSLGEIAHYLPASFVALNAADDTVSTDFGPLTK